MAETKIPPAGHCGRTADPGGFSPSSGSTELPGAAQTGYFGTGKEADLYNNW